MKQISMREFQLNAPKYLKELPIELTRYKEVVAVVHLKVSDLEPHGIIKVEDVQNTGIIEKPEPIVVESKLETFQKLKEQLEVKLETKPLGRCSKCNSVTEVESIVYEDSQGTEYKMSLCTKCLGRLKTQINQSGGRIL